MISPQQLRILATIIVFISLKIYNSSLLSVLFSLFLLDFLDCSTLTNKFLYPKYKCLRKYKNDPDNKKEYVDYQKKDKVIDLFAYLLVFILFHNLMGENISLFYIILFLWRSVGVLKYYKTEDTKNLKIFFDGINGLLVLSVLSSHYDFVKNNFNLLLIPIMLLKIIFENLHH